MEGGLVSRGQGTWASDGDPNTLDELWAFGFRNPHRLTWDYQGTGALLVAKIGEDNIEEVNLVTRGGDYGWPAREGTFLLDPANSTVVFPLPEGDSSFGYAYPVAQYDHDEGFAIVGGPVYQGCRNPELDGLFLFGDIPTGRVFHTAADSLQIGSQGLIQELTLTSGRQETTLADLADHSRVDLRFGFDLEGDVYVLTKADGKVRMLAPTVTDCHAIAFLRGDANDDGLVDIVDPLVVLFFLFQGTPNPACEKYLDADDSGIVDTTVGVRLLMRLFGDRLPLPPPRWQLRIGSERRLSRLCFVSGLRRLESVHQKGFDMSGIFAHTQYQLHTKGRKHSELHHANR